MVGTLPFCSISLLTLCANSTLRLREALLKPVVSIPTSILPDNGSVADCFRASLCNLKYFCCTVNQTI